jgi:hypothetical protein
MTITTMTELWRMSATQLAEARANRRAGTLMGAETGGGLISP